MSTTATDTAAPLAAPAAPRRAVLRWLGLLALAMTLAAGVGYAVSGSLQVHDLAFIGALLLANALLARALNQRASSDPSQRQMGYLLGHFARMLVLLLAIILLLASHLVQPLSFTLSVLAGYACFWLAELLALYHTANRMQT